MRRLSNTTREYEWGSTTAIPSLLGTPVTGAPQAELWLGAHPAAPSRVVGDGTLIELIARDPLGALGARCISRFGVELPFLMKVLAAARPLSLQVHPSEAQARAGFAAEDAAGVPIDAAERNFRDVHHKPEMIIALGPFEALSGFRAPSESRRAFRALLGVPVPGSMHARLDGALALAGESAALREAFALILSGDPEVTALADELSAAAGADEAGATGVDGDTVRAVAEFFPRDPGIAGALLLNRVHLDAGEALFLDAGIVHAYLNGLGIEVMAASDNVLRGGLTPKHVDVSELLRVVRFEATKPDHVVALHSEWPGSRSDLYSPRADEFVVDHVEIDAGFEYPLFDGVPRIVLCTRGDVALTGFGGESLTVARGQSAFVPAADARVRAVAGARGATLFISECVLR